MSTLLFSLIPDPQGLYSEFGVFLIGTERPRLGRRWVCSRLEHLQDLRRLVSIIEKCLIKADKRFTVPQHFLHAKKVYWLSLLSSGLLFTTAIVIVMVQETDETFQECGLQVEPRTKFLKELTSGHDTIVVFNVANTSLSPIRLLGLGVPMFCTEWGCIGATDLPLRLPPRSSSKFSMNLRLRSHGHSRSFSCDVILYSDAPGHEQTPLRIVGTFVSFSHETTASGRETR